MRTTGSEMRPGSGTGSDLAGPAGRVARRAAALAVLALAATAAAANGPGLPAPLTPYEAEYRVSRGPLTLGRSVTRLAPATEGWEYRTVTTATGAARLFVSGDAIERTLFDTDGESLRTLVYEQRLPNDGGEARVRFDWEAAQALVDNEDGSLVVPLAAGTRDPHGAILRVMLALARDEAVPSFEIIDDDGDVTLLHFEIRGRESIRVPLGTFDTVEVRRVREDKDRQLIAWFAPELGWLPVRIQQIDEGSTVARMDLRRLNDEQPAPATPEPRRR